MRRGDLDDLAVFVAVARERSFTRAAAKLGRSPSALSHALRGLEDRLGVRLLARTTRSVAPTAAGEQLLETLTPAFAEVERGLERLGDFQGMPSGTLRIATFDYAARTILAPRLPAFLKAHPDLSVEVVVDDRPVDLIQHGFDAGIRMAEAIERDMIAIPVGPALRTLVVGTPHYFERHGQPQTPSEIARHTGVNYRLIGGGGLLPWEFERGGQQIKVRPGGQLIVNSWPLAAAAIRSGVALGYALESEVADDIADGRLIQVLEDWSPPFDGCQLFYPDRRVSPALRALIEALK